MKIGQSNQVSTYYISYSVIVRINLIYVDHDIHNIHISYAIYDSHTYARHRCDQIGPSYHWHAGPGARAKSVAFSETLEVEIMAKLATHGCAWLTCTC